MFSVELFYVCNLFQESGAIIEKIYLGSINMLGFPDHEYGN